MLFRIFSYLKFLLKSTNEHGVHSPFVFDFVTKGLYNKKIKNVIFNDYQQLEKLSKKKKKILSKIVFHFKVNTIFFEKDNFSKFQNNNFKILYTKNLSSIQKLEPSSLSAKHIVIIDSIHQNKQSYQNWKKFTQNKEITVSIDLFYLGLLFFRKEQAKEHFKIRV